MSSFSSSFAHKCSPAPSTSEAPIRSQAWPEEKRTGGDFQVFKSPISQFCTTHHCKTNSPDFSWGTMSGKTRPKQEIQKGGGGSNLFLWLFPPWALEWILIQETQTHSSFNPKHHLISVTSPWAAHWRRQQSRFEQSHLFEVKRKNINKVYQILRNDPANSKYIWAGLVFNKQV